MILKLGIDDSTTQPPTLALDVSDYVATGYKVQIKPVYDSGFTAADGSEHKTRICDKIHISADLEGLDRTTAVAVMAKCAAETLTVTFGSPSTTQAVFNKPEVQAEMVVEGDTTGYGEIWDIHLDMESVALNRL